MKNLITNARTAWIAVLAILLAVALAACSTDADVVNENLANDADNFKVSRQIVFYNGINGEYLAEVKGLCQVENDGGRVAVTCKVGEDKYIRNMMGLSDNVTYIVLQTEADASTSSADQYKVTLKPSTVIPDVEFR